jgi:putative ABC transport system substrate-binding protein
VHRFLTRRQFVGAVGLGLVAGCGLPGAAPPAAKIRRIGYLSAFPPSAANEARVSAFRQGMRELGYVEGVSLLIAERHAAGTDRLADPAAELVGLQPEVILVAGPAIARAVLAATTTPIPVVSAGTGTGGPDLVASGLAASHAQPGGSVTGLSAPPLVGKQLQLLQEAVPSLARVAILFNRASPDFRSEPFEAAARPLGLQLQFRGIRGAEELESLFATATGEHADGIFLPSFGLITGYQTRIAELALHSRLPSMWAQSDAVGHGGLMAYAPNLVSLYRRAAYYVDRILKGTSPADLPIEEPREFDLAINLRSAQALGLTIPPHVLAQATEVIQ